MVVEQPPKGLGTINDMWFGWIIDIGFPGPDRGEGGRYLLLPPGYDGPVPDGGFYVARSKTNAGHLCRSRLTSSTTIRSRPSRTIKKNDEDLSLHAGRRRHEHRDGARRQGQARSQPAGSRDQVRGGERKIVQHDPAKRLLVLRDDQRQRPGRAGRFLQSGACRTIGGHRHREGQGVQAGRPDEEDTHRRGRGRKCCRTSAQLALQRASSRLDLLPGLILGQHAVAGWRQFRDAAADDHQGGLLQTVAADRRADPRFARRRSTTATRSTRPA